MAEEEKKETTENPEFLKGWNIEQATPEGEKETPSPDTKPDEKETVVEDKETTGKETAKEKQKEPEKEPDKSGESEPKKSDATVIEDENSATYKQRWKSLDGILNSEKAKREAAEKRAKELEDKLKAIPETKPDEAKIETNDKEAAELDELEDKYFEAMLAENKDEAKKIRKQIDTIRFRIFTETSQKKTAEMVKSEVTNEKMTDAVEEIRIEAEKKYPFLDVSKPDTCNPYAVRLIQAVRDDYRSQGLNFVEALSKAVEEVAPMFNGKAKPLEEPKGEPVDKDKLKSTVVVNIKSTPVQAKGKIQTPGTFADGWAKG